LLDHAHAQWEALSQQTGITQVQVWLMQQHGELMLMTLRAQNPQQILKALVTATHPFDCWLQTRLQTLLGWNIQETLADMPEDLIFAWSDEGGQGPRADDISRS
jgi:hypothetical protein